MELSKGDTYWADKYTLNQRSADEALDYIRNGQRIFIGSACGEPQHLARALGKLAPNRADIEIVRLFSLENTPLTRMVAENESHQLNIRSFYLGSAQSEQLSRNARFMTPINLSALPRLFRTRQMPVNVALIQVTPPDDFGMMSLGVAVDITLAAALSADLVIAQVNPQMPKVLGRSFIHVNDVDIFVEHDEPLLTMAQPGDMPAADIIGRMISRHIEDGATLQISPGTTLRATLLALSDRNDLGVHTQFLTRDVMQLFAQGVITNRKKGFNERKMVASAAAGSEDLYEFINDNPSIEFHPSDYVNDPGIIARHNKMVALNVAMAIDLTGQVAADALPINNFTGISGMLDFMRGAAQSPGGKSILMLPATTADGKRSRILPILERTAVVVPRGDVNYVATEYGVVNLFGKSLEERALALISIAHPQFREELLFAGKQLNLFSASRTLGESIRAVYPLKLEETRRIDGFDVTLRPVKPVDGRRIQDHFYKSAPEDLNARMFVARARADQAEGRALTQIDYINNLCMVAIIGEFGFGEVIGIGEYQKDRAGDMAEVALSVSKQWQGKGIGPALLKKLAQAAQENGIQGFTARIPAVNEVMEKMFALLPFEFKRIETEDGQIELRTRFDTPTPENAEKSDPGDKEIY
ncbi:MAG: GNAT family N-acetyltransferase [Desulfobacterales bacterium]